MVCYIQSSSRGWLKHSVVWHGQQMGGLWRSLAGMDLPQIASGWVRYGGVLRQANGPTNERDCRANPAEASVG